MRIDSSIIGMESERRYSVKATRETKVTMTHSKKTLADGTGGLFGNFLSPEGEEESQVKEGKTSGNFVEKTMEEMRAKLEKARNRNIRTIDLEETEKQYRDIRQQCLNFLMELFFPSRRERYGYGEENGEDGAAEGNAGSGAQLLSEGKAVSAEMTTFSFSRQYYYEETESTTFTTKGCVKCADGRELDFNLNVEMSRSFREYYEENYFVAQASLTDPLVINLDGNIAEMTDQTFFFDIDADGIIDEVNELAAGSGYLALDGNSDGVINDGSELFGTKSGDGFADLAAYDEDGNGFIDEADSVFAKLKIWVLDENGNRRLFSLLEKGVGAIALKNASTDFSLTNQDNSLKGMIRKTGFFLYENGGAGTIQHVDVAKYNQAG